MYDFGGVSKDPAEFEEGRGSKTPGLLPKDA
jgi:hypothetical protein